MPGMPTSVELLLLLSSAACACAVLGPFLVLRRVALITDAISHVLLFGIVVAYLIFKDVDSPWLFFGAAASGLLTVALVEALQKSRFVKSDAAIGLVFPTLFALGALLLTLFIPKTTHLDVDQVLLGSPEFGVQDVFLWNGQPVIAKGTLVLAGLFLLNLVVILLCYKELKLSTFDPALAAVFGFAPVLLHYVLMSLVSLSAVAAFNAVGPITVVALFVVPAACAYLLSDRLSIVILLSVVFALLGSYVGVWLALTFDTNIGGTVATVLGGLFGVVWLFAPPRGLLWKGLQHLEKRARFHELLLAIHLFQHEGTPAEADEAALDGLHRHFHWPPDVLQKVLNRAIQRGWVQATDTRLILTPSGRIAAQTAFRLPVPQTE
jgi:manganese/zinc/iron transport system permease protein